MSTVRVKGKLCKKFLLPDVQGFVLKEGCSEECVKEQSDMKYIVKMDIQYVSLEQTLGFGPCCLKSLRWTPL